MAVRLQEDYEYGLCVYQERLGLLLIHCKEYKQYVIGYREDRVTCLKMIVTAVGNDRKREIKITWINNFAGVCS